MQKRPHLAAAWAVVTALAAAVGTLLGPHGEARAGGCATVAHYTFGFGVRAGSSVPEDGGVLLVPTRASGYGARGAGLGELAAVPHAIERADGAAAATWVDLAPGWALLRPEQPLRGRATAVLGDERRAFVFGPRGRGTLGAPRDPVVAFHGSVAQGGGPRGPSQTMAYNSVELRRPPPAGVRGVIVRYTPAAGEAPRARGFGVAVEARGQRSFLFGARVGRCSPNLPGNVVRPDSQVDVLFVDARGRLSAPVSTRVGTAPAL